MKTKEMIIKSLKRVENERGLRISKPNFNLSEGHIRKADHNLIVMTDLGKLGHEDWVVVSAYYSMYHATLALLVKIGLESKDHATTVAVLEYFFSEQIRNEMIEKFNALKEKKDKNESMIIGEKYINYLWKIKRERETAQYGIFINHREINNVMNNTREFVKKIKLVLNELDENLINMISKEIKNLEAMSKR